MPNKLFASQRYTAATDYPAEYQGRPVTPNDSADLPDGPCVALRITGSGNINVDLGGGATAVLTNVVAGQTLRLQVFRVRATSTTGSCAALYPAGTL